MTALIGTVVTPGVNGEVGEVVTAMGTYDLAGALVNADTITWPGLLPKNGDYQIQSMRFWAPELDTNATPTGTIIIGDGTDTDAYLTTINIGLPAVAPANGSQLNYNGNGASIRTNITTPVPDVVLTVTGVVATGATSGTIFVEFTLKATA